MNSIVSLLKTEFAPQIAGELLFEEPLARYTSFKIGGLADALFYPAQFEELRKAIQFCKTHKLPFFILGNGSNLLIKDGGLRGLVLKLNRCLNQFEFAEDSTQLTVEAGVALPKIVELAKQKGLSGLESLYGIPCTVGGALFMNAGTREGEIGSCVTTLETLDRQGKTHRYQAKELIFEYRHLKNPKNEVLLKATLELKKSTPEKVADRISFFQERRKKTQPLDLPNCGSVFKNPPKKYAAALIDELGLKGVRVGGARISEKHANWIVNEGGAKAQDVLALIGLVKDKVKETHGIVLETEVKIIGEEGAN